MITLPSQISRFVNSLGNIVPPWVQYLQQFTQLPPAIMTIVVTASPFSYVAKEPGYAHINGGVVSSVILRRGNVDLIFTGMKAVPVSINDIVIITYSGLPTVKFVPSYGQNTMS
jgi:hypothetical protein